MPSAPAIALLVGPAVMTPAGWRPGVGDPDFLGWAITVTYVLVAGLCAWAYRAERQGGSLRRRHLATGRPALWLALAGVLVFFGLNKQFDFQELIVATGKDVVASAGLAGHKTAVVAGFVAVMGLAGAAAATLMLAYVGRLWRRYLLAFVGAAYLGTFVVARAASHLPVLDRINHRYLDAMHLVLELGSLIIIGVCAARALGFQRDRQRAARQDELIASGGGIRVVAALRPVMRLRAAADTAARAAERARRAA